MLLLTFLMPNVFNINNELVIDINYPHSKLGQRNKTLSRSVCLTILTYLATLS